MAFDPRQDSAVGCFRLVAIPGRREANSGGGPKAAMLLPCRRLDQHGQVGGQKQLLRKGFLRLISVRIGLRVRARDRRLRAGSSLLLSLGLAVFVPPPSGPALGNRPGGDGVLPPGGLVGIIDPALARLGHLLAGNAELVGQFLVLDLVLAHQGDKGRAGDGYRRGCCRDGARIVCNRVLDNFSQRKQICEHVFILSHLENPRAGGSSGKVTTLHPFVWGFGLSPIWAWPSPK